VLHFRRRVTLDNLHLALGDRYSEGELVRIGREAYANIGITFAEAAINPRFKDRVLEMVDYTAFQPVRDAYAAGKGFIVLTCHYGSWEYTGYSIAAQGVPLTAVGKTQANRAVDRFIVSRRKLMGIGVVAKGAQVKEMILRLRKGESVALVSDQNAGRNGIPVPFFGHPASTPTGAAQLALRYHVPVLAIVCERVRDGYYRFLCEKLPVNADDTVEALTERMSLAIENIIRRHPEQYFWMHRRWKKTATPGIAWKPTQHEALSADSGE
jgi:KDO2-lipid IV(A) lauroyltransferase